MAELLALNATHLRRRTSYLLALLAGMFGIAGAIILLALAGNVSEELANADAAMAARVAAAGILALCAGLLWFRGRVLFGSPVTLAAPAALAVLAVAFGADKPLQCAVAFVWGAALGYVTCLEDARQDAGQPTWKLALVTAGVAFVGLVAVCLCGWNGAGLSIDIPMLTPALAAAAVRLGAVAHADRAATIAPR